MSEVVCGAVCFNLQLETSVVAAAGVNLDCVECCLVSALVVARRCRTRMVQKLYRRVRMASTRTARQTTITLCGVGAGEHRSSCEGFVDSL